MPILNLNTGININYNLTGKGESIIFLHNGFDSTSTWSKIREKMSKYFTVIDYDRYGYGLSDRLIHEITGDIIEHGVEELNNLVNKLNLKIFYLCGHCLGGAIAIYYTIKYPHKVKKLIIESVGYYTNDLIIIKSDWTFQPFECIDNNLRQKLIKMHGDEYSKELWKYLCNYKEGYIMNKNYNIIEKIKEIKCPTFIISGDKDFYFDVDQAVKAFNTIKNSKLWIIPDTGHEPHIEREDEFVNNLNRFLK